MNQNAIFQYLAIDKVIKKSKEKGAEISKKDENLARFMPLISPTMAGISTVISIDNVQKKIPAISPNAQSMIKSAENNHLNDIQILGQALSAQQITALRPLLSTIVQQQLNKDLQNPNAPTLPTGSNLTEAEIFQLMFKVLQNAGIIPTPSGNTATNPTVGTAGSGTIVTPNTASKSPLPSQTRTNNSPLDAQLNTISTQLKDLTQNVKNLKKGVDANKAKLDKLTTLSNPKNNPPLADK